MQQMKQKSVKKNNRLQHSLPEVVLQKVFFCLKDGQFPLDCTLWNRLWKDVFHHIGTCPIITGVQDCIDC